MSAEEREPWEHLSSKDLERYKREVADSLGKSTPTSVTTTTTTPTKKSKVDVDSIITTISVDGVEIHKPKQPAGAYGIYCVEYRKKNSDKKLANSEVGESWRSLPKEEKERFEKRAIAEQEKFDQDIKVWEETLTKYAVAAESDPLY